MIMEGDNMKKDELRVIPKRNYLILGIVLLVSFLLIYYFYMWFDAYNESKLNKPILDKYIDVINYNELSDYLIESPDSIIYVSILEDNEIRDFEKKFKNVLKTHQIEEDILYMNITEELKDDTLRQDMISKYSFNNANISNVPCILVIDGGKLSAIYNIKASNYDINGLKMFIDSIKFSSDGEIDG